MRKEPNHEIVCCLPLSDVIKTIFDLPSPLHSLSHTHTLPLHANTHLSFSKWRGSRGCGWFEVRYGVGQEWISMPWTNWFWVPAVRRGYTTLLHISRSGYGKATKTVSCIESSSFSFKLRDFNIVTTAATMRSVVCGFSRPLRVCGLYRLFVL